MKSLAVQANAKVNLFLEIGESRADGYHEVRSILTPVSLSDTVVLERRADGVEAFMESDGAVGMENLPTLDSDENLVVRAARALQEETGCTEGVRIRVDKAIPVGGGLGGGSADAAAVLTGLNRLWNTGLSRARLMEIGLRLGCDVPALVHGGAVAVEGRGERVQAVNSPSARPPVWLTLANPGFHVSTRDVFSRYTALTYSPVPFKDAVSIFEKGDPGAMARMLFNSLQPSVFEKYPLIEMTAESLATAGATAVLLCGSGATVMGLASGEEQAREIERTLRTTLDFPVWTRAVRLLPDGVMVAHGPLEARV